MVLNYAGFAGRKDDIASLFIVFDACQRQRCQVSYRPVGMVTQSIFLWFGRGRLIGVLGWIADSNFKRTQCDANIRMNVLNLAWIHPVLDHQPQQATGELDAAVIIGNVGVDQGPHFYE